MASIAGRTVLLMALVMGTPVEPGWGEELQGLGLVRCQEVGSRMNLRRPRGPPSSFDFAQDEGV